MTDETPPPPPHDFRAEQAVLGCMILANGFNAGAIDEIQQILHGPEDFYTARHQTIYTAILDQYASGKPIDPIALTAHMRETGDLTKIGGPVYLSELVQAVPTVAHAQHYAQTVRDCAFRAQLDTVFTTGHNSARDPGEDPAAVAEAATEQLQRLVSGATETTDVFWAGDHFMTLIEQLENPETDPVIKTPWPDLDTVVKLRPGQLVIVGARPGGGKSVLGLNLAVHAALTHGMPAVLFSMEMGGDQVMARYCADQARIPLSNIEENRVTDDELLRMTQAMSRLATGPAPLYIDDTPRLSIGRLRARLRQLQSAGRPARVVVVDYIQLMQLDASWGRQRWEQLGALSRELKILAGEFGVLVIAATQLNRNPEMRTDKKPSMGDLRESGSFENDANIILLLHKNPPDPSGEPQRGRMDVIVAKNRQGQSDVTVPLLFQGKYQRLVRKAKGPQPCAEQMAYVADEGGG